jgi:hypothetical protein
MDTGVTKILKVKIGRRSIAGRVPQCTVRYAHVEFAHAIRWRQPYLA